MDKLTRTCQLALIVIFSLWGLTCCADNNETLKIGVFSDPHFLSEKLMDDGSAIMDYQARTGKFVHEVPQVLQQVLDNYLQSDIEVLLIPGDLTKDGEKQSHIDFANKLKPLQKKGVKVYVIPGNHDINVPKPLGYKNDSTFFVQNVSPEEFTDIYKDCGYADALESDTASLSYVAALNSSTWLLAIDSNKYKEYKSQTISAGSISKQTELWIVKILDQAKKNNIQVIGMMHHGLVEHIPMQSLFFKDYLVEDWSRLAEVFADHNMKVIFTGHFHSNDISEFISSDNKKIYDIETGSLSCYAFPYRFTELNRNGIKVVTKNIVSTSKSPNLAADSKSVMENIAKHIAVAKLKRSGFQLSDKILDSASNIIAQIFVKHLSGDENIDADLKKSITELAKDLDTPFDFAEKISGIDFYPADNDVEINF